MNSKELLTKIATDTSGKWISVDKLDQIIQIIAQESVDVVTNTPKHCAFTTYDLGTVECTIAKSIELLQEKFSLK
jgi:deoxyxylulose-5-phosphate synthase